MHRDKIDKDRTGIFESRIYFPEKKSTGGFHVLMYLLETKSQVKSEKYTKIAAFDN